MASGCHVGELMATHFSQLSNGFVVTKRLRTTETGGEEWLKVILKVYERAILNWNNGFEDRNFKKDLKA